MLDLRRLRYFLEIANQGSISRAARTLHVAQPALSHHVAEMERELGTRLFNRLPRGVELTAPGRILHRHARTILHDVAAAEEELRKAAGAARATSIALLPSVATTLTPVLLAASRRELAGAALQIVEGRTEQNHAMVSGGQVDMAVLIADPRWPDAMPLGEERLYLIEAADRCARRGPVRFSDLASRRLILPAQDNRLRQLVTETARQMGIDLEVAAEIDGLQSVKRAVASGHGSAILSWHAVRHECDAGELAARPMIEPVLRRMVVLEAGPRADRSVVDAVRILVAGALREAAVRAERIAGSG